MSTPLVFPCVVCFIFEVVLCHSIVWAYLREELSLVFLFTTPSLCVLCGCLGHHVTPCAQVYELGNADELTDDDELYSDCGEEAHGQGDHNIRRLDSVTGLSVNEGTSLVPAESRKSDRAAEKSGYGTTERVPSAEMDLEELHRGSQSRSRSTSVWSIIKQRWIVVFGVETSFSSVDGHCKGNVHVVPAS